MANKLGIGGFKKGQSGNPSGRAKATPEMLEVRELAKAYTREAVETLAAVMRSSKSGATARAIAANSLLDRGHGKAPQHIMAEVSYFEKMSLDERRALDAALAALARGEGDAASGEPPTHH